MVKTIKHYLQNSPVSSKDLLLWFCVFISLIPAGYSFYLLPFYTVGLIGLKVLMVFLIVLILVE